MKLKCMKALFFIVFLFMLSIAVGCNKQTEETVADKDETNNETQEQKTGSENSVLNIAIDSTPPTLDQQISVSASTRDVSRLIYESLLTTDADFTPIPMLAESIDISDDGTVYTFHLRQGVKFHNGKEMVADDVIASMERWEEKTALSGEIFNGATWEEDDEYTVILTLSSPSPLTLDTIATSKHAPAIMPKEIIESSPAEGVAEYIGTGPYRLTEWKEDQYIHFTKNEDYLPLETEASGLGGKKEALINDIYFYLVPDSSTRLAGILSGEYDLAYGIPQDNYEQLTNSESIEPILVPGSNPILKFNNVEGIVSDFEFRQIINTALDYNEIMMAAFASEEFYELDSGYMHKDVTAWASQAGSEYYNINDPEKAEQMLEAYGYNGEEVVIMATRDFQWMYNIGVAVDEQLKKIGINSKLDVYDYPTFSDMANKTEAWDIEVQGITMTSTPPQLTSLSTTWSGGVNDPNIPEGLKAIENASSLEEAYQLWDELQLYVWEEHLPIINFGHSYTLYGMSKKIQGLEMSTIGPVLWNTTVSE